MQTGALEALPAGSRRIKQRSQALETGGRTSGESALIVLHAAYESQSTVNIDSGNGVLLSQWMWHPTKYQDQVAASVERRS